MVESQKIETNEHIKDKLKKILVTFLDALPEDICLILSQNHQKF